MTNEKKGEDQSDVIVPLKFIHLNFYFLPIKNVSTVSVQMFNGNGSCTTRVANIEYKCKIARDANCEMGSVHTNIGFVAKKNKTNKLECTF